MPTITVIRNRVTTRVIDLPNTVLFEIPHTINKVVRDLQEGHNFKVMETKTGSLSTTSGSHVLAAVPTDMKEQRGLPYLLMNDGSTRDLVMAPNLAAALDVFPFSDANDIGEPKLLLDPEPDDDGVRSWQVYPYPDGNSDWSDGEYRIVVPYWRYLTELDFGVLEENWFTTNAGWFIVFQATAEAFYMDWDEERGQFWEARAQGEMAKVFKSDKRARLGTVRHLAVHRDVYAPRLRS